MKLKKLTKSDPKDPVLLFLRKALLILSGKILDMRNPTI